MSQPIRWAGGDDQAAAAFVREQGGVPFEQALAGQRLVEALGGVERDGGNGIGLAVRGPDTGLIEAEGFDAFQRTAGQSGCWWMQAIRRMQRSPVISL